MQGTKTCLTTAPSGFPTDFTDFQFLSVKSVKSVVNSVVARGEKVGWRMNQKRSGAATRDLIFSACGRILRRDGLTSLTLDAVAAEAGLSKGGLLYHFPSKVALIEALFQHHIDRFNHDLRQLVATEEQGPGGWLRAYAKASMPRSPTRRMPASLPAFLLPVNAIPPCWKLCAAVMWHGSNKWRPVRSIPPLPCWCAWRWMVSGLRRCINTRH